MGQIGSFGKTIVFEVSGDKVFTPNGIQRKVAGRWKQHNILGKTPKSELLGPDADETSCTITLSAEHGVKPRETIERIEKAVKNGETEYLVIGGKKVGSNKTYISSMSEEWDTIWNKGELVKAKINLTFAEYA